MTEQTIRLDVQELKQLVLQAARLGGLEAMKYQRGTIISQNQAFQKYGKKLIQQLTEDGVITLHKRYNTSYTKGQYNVIEIEAALMAIQIDSSIRRQNKDNIVKVKGIKSLAVAYNCSYANAKLLRRKLAPACSKQGREIVIDLGVADKIIPIPKTPK